MFELCSVRSGFDLTTRDSYFTIQVKIFMNLILLQNTNSTKSYSKVNRTQDYGLKTNKQAMAMP